MNTEKQKNILIALLVVAVVGLGVFMIRQSQQQDALLAQLASRPRPAGKNGRQPVDPYIAGPVKNRILKGYPQIQQCYKSFLNSKPTKTDGIVSIDWQIDTNGEVIKPQKVISDIEDASLIDCMQKAIATWGFPPPLVQKYVMHRFKFTKK